MVTKRLQYRYDAVGNKVGMTDADGGLFTYTYDAMRRLTGVINPVGERTTYTYDLNGRRTSAQLSNGTRTSYSYDQGSRVQQIHTLKSNNSTVAKFDYAYDDNGRRTSVLEADGSRVTWTYDGTSQVTSEWRTGTSPFRHTFVYDTRGNRTLKVEDGARTTLVYDAANQLSSSEDVGGTTNYTYDANGNQHVTVAPGGSRTTQIWDYENRLVKTLQPGGGVFTMAYNADGLRVRKETPSEAKLFVWDDQNYLAETDDSGVTEVAYTTEPSTYGSTISHRSGGATTTYHFDALAAARVLTNSSETVLESYNYTAFDTILDSPTLLSPFLWGGLVGYYWDADLGSNYIRARHYQPNIARWISLDPIGFAGGDANLFRYVGNSPTSGTSVRQVVLSASSYGRLQTIIGPALLAYLLLTRMQQASKGLPHGYDPMLYAYGGSSSAMRLTARHVDPAGLCYSFGGAPNCSWDPVKGPWEKGCRDFFYHYYGGNGSPIDISGSQNFVHWFKQVKDQLGDFEREVAVNAANSASCGSKSSSGSGRVALKAPPGASDIVTAFLHCLHSDDPNTVMGKSQPRYSFMCSESVVCKCCGGSTKPKPVYVDVACEFTYDLGDKYKDPLGMGVELPLATLYPIDAKWKSKSSYRKTFPCI